jgi:hypothetical protein
MNFYEFDIPAKINGTQLKQELGCAEVYICDGKLIIGGDLTEEEAAAGLNSHVPVDLEAEAATKAANKAALLERLGITEEEARLLLS